MPPQGQSLWNFRHENIIYQDTSCPIDYCPQHWRFYLMKVPVMVMGCWCWCWWILEALVFFMAARAIWQSNMACWQIPPSTLMIFPARNLHLDSLHQFSHYYIYDIYNIIYILKCPFCPGISQLAMFDDAEVAHHAAAWGWQFVRCVGANDVRLREAKFRITRYRSSRRLSKSPTRLMCRWVLCRFFLGQQVRTSF